MRLFICCINSFIIYFFRTDFICCDGRRIKIGWNLCCFVFRLGFFLFFFLFFSFWLSTWILGVCVELQRRLAAVCSLWTRATVARGRFLIFESLLLFLLRLLLLLFSFVLFFFVIIYFNECFLNRCWVSNNIIYIIIYIYCWFSIIVRRVYDPIRRLFFKIIKKCCYFLSCFLFWKWYNFHLF